MKTSYKILFLIELLHDYYRDLQCRDFSITPSADTQSRLRDKQMLCKMVGNKFFVLAKVNADDNKPIVPIDPAFTFRFYLELNGLHFITLTRLELDTIPRRRLYFNNLSQNKPGLYAYLCKPLSAHNLATAYAKTDLVAKNSKVFECIQPTGGADVTNASFWDERNKTTAFDIDDAHKEGDIVIDDGREFIKLKDGSGRPTSDSLFWKLRGFSGLAQYVTEKDLTELTPFIKEFGFSADATNFDISVLGLNVATNQFDREVLSHTMVTESPVRTIRVNFSEFEPGKYTGLQPGKYIVKINGTSFDLYIDDDAFSENAFGIIDIFGHLPDGDDFALLDGGAVKETADEDKPPGLNYTIRFANRLAFWKYLTPRHGVRSINAAEGYSFAPTLSPAGVANFFTSNKQIPLTESPRKFTPELFIEVFSDKKPILPNPDPAIAGMMKKEVAHNDYYCSINLLFNKP